MPNIRSRKNLIVLDGLDGTGKTSGLQVLNTYLAKNFPDTPLVSAEGYTFNEFCADLKATMMKHKRNVSHNVLYNLFRAIWTDAWEKHGEAVTKGELFLVTDRWLLSTAVYQDESNTRVSNLISSTHAIPGLTILLTASSEVAKSRISSTRELDAFEEEYFTKHDELQKRFIDKLPTYSDQYVIINTDVLSQRDVAVAIREALDAYFGEGNV